MRTRLCLATMLAVVATGCASSEDASQGASAALGRSGLSPLASPGGGDVGDADAGEPPPTGGDPGTTNVDADAGSDPITPGYGSGGTGIGTLTDGGAIVFPPPGDPGMGPGNLPPGGLPIFPMNPPILIQWGILPGNGQPPPPPPPPPVPDDPGIQLPPGFVPNLCKYFNGVEVLQAERVNGQLVGDALACGRSTAEMILSGNLGEHFSALATPNSPSVDPGPPNAGPYVATDLSYQHRINVGGLNDRMWHIMAGAPKPPNLTAGSNMCNFSRLSRIYATASGPVEVFVQIGTPWDIGIAATSPYLAGVAQLLAPQALNGELSFGHFTQVLNTCSNWLRDPAIKMIPPEGLNNDLLLGEGAPWIWEPSRGVVRRVSYAYFFMRRVTPDYAASPRAFANIQRVDYRMCPALATSPYGGSTPGGGDPSGDPGEPNPFWVTNPDYVSFTGIHKNDNPDVPDQPVTYTSLDSGPVEEGQPRHFLFTAPGVVPAVCTVTVQNGSLDGDCSNYTGAFHIGPGDIRNSENISWRVNNPGPNLTGTFIGTGTLRDGLH